MALVDRKVSLPGDFDIQVAYIYPTPIESMELDMSDEDVSINISVINLIHQIVDNLILMLPEYNLNNYNYILAESIQQEFSIRRKERKIL